MNPILMGAIAGVGLSQMYRSGARTEPHVTPQADPRASMRHRVESASAPQETSQLTPEENEIYTEVYEARVASGATPEEADRLAMEAVERFREEQRRADRDAERERERRMEEELDRERRDEYYRDRRASRTSGGILAVRPGPSGASRAERIVLDTPGNRGLGAAPGVTSGDMVRAARQMADAYRRRGGRT